MQSELLMILHENMLSCVMAWYIFVTWKGIKKGIFQE